MLKQPIFQLEENFDFANMTFYHGTTSALAWGMVNEGGLEPPYKTGVLREPERTEFLDKVFFTNNLASAIRYAKKAVKKFGGYPWVLKVDPIGEIWNVRDDEFVADSASIITTAWDGRSDGTN